MYMYATINLDTDSRLNVCPKLTLNISMSQGRKKHTARPGLEPRTCRIPCEHSDHWDTEPYGRPVTISLCLIKIRPRICSELCRNRRDSPFAARSPSTDPYWATKCHRGGISTWPDRDSNPGPLAYRASTLATELPSHMVDLWHLYEPPHDKSNKMICAPSEDSDQPGHPPRLIGVFTVRSMGR